VASWYGPGFIGRLTASGERYTAQEMTAAHRVLPFGTLVRVTHLQNGRSVVVRINDRGPFLKGRVIDLSQAAAKRLGMIHSGIARVRLEYASSLATNSRLLAAATQDPEGSGIANTPALKPYSVLNLME
jgi:rare lipoprotein A